MPAKKNFSNEERRGNVALYLAVEDVKLDFEFSPQRALSSTPLI
jgi:hypothetical protein